MKLVSITPSSAKDKRYVAKFCLCSGKSKCCEKDKKTINFGMKGGSTFIDHGDEKKKDAYIARHKVNENFNDPLTAGALSRWVLWNKTTLQASIADFKKKFNL